MLKGKNALVTGSAKGIGREIALALAKNGANVGVNDIAYDSISKEAIELIDSALDKDDNSLLVRLIRVKLQARSHRNGKEMTRELDDIIHFLVEDKQFQKYKNISTDSDVIWLYEASGDSISG